MISKKYRTLISNTGTEKIYFLFFSSIIVVFFEMLGIGSVPVFAYIIIDPDVFFNTLSEKFNISREEQDQFAFDSHIKATKSNFW